MKTTPIYILLIIFFLNFDLVWGLTIPLPRQYHLWQIQYSFTDIDKSNFQSISLAYYLNSDKVYLNSDKVYRKNVRNSLLLTHRLRLNIGLTKVLAEADYDLGLNFANLSPLHILPYITLGTNIYSFAYGGGLDLKYMANRQLFIVGSLNYRTTEKLFGHTDAQQWYQSGYGVKLGVEIFLYTTGALPKDYDKYNDY